MSSERPSERLAGEGGPSTSSARAPLLAFADGLLAAGKDEHTQSVGEVRQYVSFMLRDEEFAVPILHCREILRASSITRLPEAPFQVRGVVNLRGRIVPAVDVRACLGLELAVITGKSRLIVVEIAGRYFALLVDRVARIFKLPSAQVVPPPETGRFCCLAGMATAGNSAIHIIDTEQMLLASPDMRPSTGKE
jgi:purine-binding chemotaxis protein CheW